MFSSGSLPFSPWSGSAFLPPSLPGEPELDADGFPIADIRYVENLSLQEEEHRIQTQTKGKPLEKVQIEYLVNSVISATELKASPLDWGRMVVLDIKYLFDNIPNQLTWFRVSLFSLVYFGDQNIFLSVVLSWISSPEGCDRWMSATVKDYISKIKFHEPVLKKYSEFKNWLNRDGSDLYMIKTGLKATFIGLNIIFKLVYDITTVYPILTYMNSEQPAIALAGALLFFLMVSRGDYVSDIHEVKKQTYNLSVEHMIHPINRELPEDLEDDEVLRDYICPISQGVMIYPAKIPCGHRMEMREVIRLRGSSSLCPCCRKTVSTISFDKEAYRVISERLKKLKISPL